MQINWISRKTCTFGHQRNFISLMPTLFQRMVATAIPEACQGWDSVYTV
jgi:hypothetical protein